MDKKVVKMNAKELADYVISQGYDKPVDFFEECDEEEGLFTENCQWGYGIIIQKGSFDNEFLMIDYYGGGSLFTVPLESYCGLQYQDNIDDIHNGIEQYLTKWIYVPEVYVEINE